MAIFDIELYLPGITAAGVRELATRVREATAGPESSGSPVRFLGATLSMRDEVCFVRLEGLRRDVDEVVARAGLLEVRVSEVVVVRRGKAR